MTQTRTYALILTLAALADLGLFLTRGDASKITEDSPQWDCHTMGNMVCGVVDNIPIG